ncbi:glycosyltransferase family 2 protein [Synechococcus sp. Tobar12-5m-g]|nr:glycosyltransferase family 2 protein [Synechococcus sp. Tobar12-5m-g]MCP9874023.1 glycosyltransferase family 2 protein [Synechococcus sp. Cruz CV-v-12]
MRSSGLRAALIFVAYHPGQEEVKRLQACLSALPEWIGYVVVANDHRVGEAVDQLMANSLLFLGNQDNPGYGRAVNQAVQALQERDVLPSFIGAINTDITWVPGTFARLITWLEKRPDVVLAVPRLISSSGETQHLCKHDPTVLGLFSRRFVPQFMKPRALRRYDEWYVMSEKNYATIFDVEYLSGCCMLIRSAAFLEVGGFDSDFFLYLEDADITRALRRIGRAIHLPLESVIHNWGRGNYRSWRLVFVNLHSAWIYFCKWGFKLF